MESPGRSSNRMLPVVLFLVGTGMSLLGNAMAMIAIPWFVLETTGSASQTGFAGVAAFLPNAIAGVLGGPLVDRLGGKRMSVIADVLSGASMLMIPLLHHLDLLTYPALLALIFMGAILDIPGVTARRTLLPGLQQQSGIRPERMNTAFEVLGNLASMVGPFVAGLIIAFTSAVNLLIFTSIGFAISAVMVAMFVDAPARDEPAERTGYLQAVAEGFAFIRATPVLVALALLFAITNFLTSGLFSVGFPVFANDVWGSPGRLGMMFSFLGVGTLLGASLYGWRGHSLRRRRRAIMLGGFMLQPLWLLVFVWSSSFPLALAAMFLSGFCVGPANPMSVTIRFEHIPERLRGRVFATFSAIAGVVMPIGIAICGVLIDAIGVRPSFAAVAIVYAVLIWTVPFIGTFRSMNDPGPFAEHRQHI